ncbi:sialate O-acetylesterase [Marinoscillum furvescens]|nr:sialate O-acetylesterase [Marinoscillum furvescens]
MNHFFRITCIAAFAVLTFSSHAQDTFRLFYLGGQSNMDGYGYVKDLPDSLNRQFENVYIFHGNTAADGATDGGLGIWEKLEPGHGVGAKATNKKNLLSERFGLELSLGAKLATLYPDDKIALIKYSKGGTSIDSLAADTFGCWEPDFRSKGGINQYDHFLATVNNALSTQDINGDGKADQIIPSGIFWMQGESDAHVLEIAQRYEYNLTRLMNLVRAAFRTDDLPVVIGKISDSNDPSRNYKVWKYGELVQHAQEQFVRKDAQAAIVRSTKHYGHSDPWHYRSEDYIDLGVEFGKVFERLSK